MRPSRVYAPVSPGIALNQDVDGRPPWTLKNGQSPKFKKHWDENGRVVPQVEQPIYLTIESSIFRPTSAVLNDLALGIEDQFMLAEGLVKVCSRAIGACSARGTACNVQGVRRVRRVRPAPRAACAELCMQVHHCTRPAFLCPGRERSEPVKHRSQRQDPDASN